ncbi:MAG: restriction endonuclease subunit S [Cyanobacteria bacterium J06627_28]
MKLQLTELPPSWSWEASGEIIDVRDGTHDTPKYLEEGVPLITSKNLKSHGIDFKNVEFISQEDHAAISKRSGVELNDVLFAMIGTIGNPVIVENEKEFSIKNVALFKFNKGGVEPRFFYRILDSDLVKLQLQEATRGGTQKFVSLKVLRNLQIPLPPLAEQKRIARILDAADALRVKRREAISQLDALLQSTFLTLFGDPVSNPMGWEVCSLENATTRITDGTHQSPKWSETGIPFLFVSNIRDRVIDFQTSRFISEDEYTKLTSRCPIEVGDVLYTTVGSYGNPAVVKDDYQRFAFQRHIAHIKPKHDLIEPKFLEIMLDSPVGRYQADRYARGVAQKTLNLRELKRFKIFLPPFEEQQHFSKIISSIEKQKVQQRAHLAELDTLFAALQSRAFKGEL